MDIVVLLYLMPLFVLCILLVMCTALCRGTSMQIYEYINKSNIESIIIKSILWFLTSYFTRFVFISYAQTDFLSESDIACCRTVGRESSTTHFTRRSVTSQENVKDSSCFLLNLTIFPVLYSKLDSSYLCHQSFVVSLAGVMTRDTRWRHVTYQFTPRLCNTSADIES